MNLTSSFIQLIWRKKSTLLGLLIVTLALGLFIRFSYQQFLYLQAQNISHLSIFNEIILPLSGLVVICQLLISLLVSVQLAPSFYLSGQYCLLQQSSLPPSRLLYSFIKTILFFSFWPLLIFALSCFVLALSSGIDLARLSLTFIGILIINIIVTQLILTMCIKGNHILLALLQSVLVISIIVFIEVSWSSISTASYSFINWSGIFLPLISIREGLFIYAHWVSYLGWVIFSVSSCYFIICRQFNKISAKAGVSIFVGMLVIILSGMISGQLDITHSKRSSLSSTLKNKLSNAKQPLLVTAIVNEQTNREEITRGFNILRESFASSKLEFKSKQSLGPKLKHSGEYVEFNLGKLNQAVAYPFTQDVKSVFESAIHQMLKRKQQWITFIEGHGEASPLGNKASDLSDLYQVLTAMGWPVAVQDLTLTPIISDNTGLIVIASSKQAWSFKEQKIILNYLSNGGSLLLLVDPDSVVPDSLESFIGISRYKGTLVDWEGYQNGTPHPAVVVAVNSGLKHPIVNHLTSPLAFPWALGLKKSSNDTNSSIEYSPIVSTHKNVWSEFNIKAETLTFDHEMEELKQSFVLAMSRYDSANQQKIIVVGDSHFASDSAINNYSNKQFALNLISWLSNSEIDDNLSTEQDNSITPSLMTHWNMSWLFSLVLPILIVFSWFLTRLYRFKKIMYISKTDSEIN